MQSILPQLIINGLIAGAIYALAASGFSLIYYVVKFQYFSHGAIMSIAAYSFFVFFNRMGMHYLIAGFLTVVLTILATLITNWLVYIPLRKRKATSIVMMISSILMLIFISSLILAIFGSSTKFISIAKTKAYDFGLARITSVQAVIIITSILMFFFLWIVLKKTKLGKAMLALADNNDVAKVIGINPEKIYTYAFIISGILGAVGGILLGLEQNLYPRMGTPIIIKGFISSTVGGLGSVPGAIIGGLFVGLAENLGLWLPTLFGFNYIDTGYKDIISFTLMLVFLLFRPQGILGVKLRDDS